MEPSLRYLYVLFGTTACWSNKYSKSCFPGRSTPVKLVSGHSTHCFFLDRHTVLTSYQ
ncbi:hypothetical protein BDV38DRAFT_262091 [Aspergillus pseudotamarii]|uniref:Uncharacterized protein n=1 Tax=Aspergillus pseudotamarii TaxID=132259 RepID=A0A5N6SE72_ASPPS|nr:uncharacterized protein BDV38DRAFT_262091 [Aspergillus pseudotamarii]KAE8132149.1 hypothetical protein BDV38DRAFT_262091 [Aspergillus pseudotamarii]